jgi:hypothetical protein
MELLRGPRMELPRMELPRGPRMEWLRAPHIELLRAPRMELRRARYGILIWTGNCEISRKDMVKRQGGMRFNSVSNEGINGLKYASGVI